MYRKIQFVACKLDWCGDSMNLLIGSILNAISCFVEVKYYKLPIILLKFVRSTNLPKLSFPYFSISSTGVRIRLHDSIFNFSRI